MYCVSKALKPVGSPASVPRKKFCASSVLVLTAPTASHSGLAGTCPPESLTITPKYRGATFWPPGLVLVIRSDTIPPLPASAVGSIVSSHSLFVFCATIAFTTPVRFISTLSVAAWSARSAVYRVRYPTSPSLSVTFLPASSTTAATCSPSIALTRVTPDGAAAP